MALILAMRERSEMYLIDLGTNIALTLKKVS